MVNQYNMSFPNKKELESKWWHRLFKVILISATMASLLVTGYLFSETFWENQQFILSFEEGYEEAPGKDRLLQDVGSRLGEDRIMDRIEKIDPPILSKNSYSIFSWDLYEELYPEEAENRWAALSETLYERCLEERKLSPAEFISRCPGAKIRVRSSCFEQMIQEYPDWQIKSWRPVRWQALLFFLFPIAAYLILWLLYQKVILYIVYGKRS